MPYSNSWTNSTPATSLTVTTAPNAGDKLIFVTVSDSTGNTISSWPSGFVAEVDQITTPDSSRLHIAVKEVATGSETTLTAVSDQAIIGCVIALSGVAASGRAFTTNVANDDVASVNNAVTSGSVTPSGDGADILAILNIDVTSGTDCTATFSNTGTLGAWTNRVDQNSGFYNIVVGTATQTTAGAITATGTSSTGGSTAGVALAVFGFLPSAATAVTLSGPTSGVTGVPTSNFTVGANGTITGTVVVTPNDSSGGGSFTPTSVSISSGSPTGTFTYTNSAVGTYTIGTTDDGGLTDPSTIAVAIVKHLPLRFLSSGLRF